MIQFLAGVLFTLFLVWVSGSRKASLPCVHKYSVLHNTYIGEGYYEYFLDEYDFCVKCGEKKTKWIYEIEM